MPDCTSLCFYNIGVVIKKEEEDYNAMRSICSTFSGVTVLFSPKTVPLILKRVTILDIISSSSPYSDSLVFTPSERKNPSVRSIMASILSSALPTVIPHTLVPYCNILSRFSSFITRSSCGNTIARV